MIHWTNQIHLICKKSFFKKKLYLYIYIIHITFKTKKKKNHSFFVLSLTSIFLSLSIFCPTLLGFFKNLYFWGFLKKNWIFSSGMRILVKDIIWVVFFLVQNLIFFALQFGIEEQSCLLLLITVVSFKKTSFLCYFKLWGCSYFNEFWSFSYSFLFFSSWITEIEIDLLCFRFM